MAATIKKGALVRVVTGNLENSLEALASDSPFTQLYVQLDSRSLGCKR